MKSIFLGFLFLLLTKLSAQDGPNYDPDKKYHPDSLQRWTTSIMTELGKKHPGFYRYTSKSRFDFLIDSTTQTIQDSLNELSFYRKIKPLFAQIGCLHTGISLSKACNNYLDSTSTLLPLEVFIDKDKKVYVVKNYSSNSSIPLKAEILAINERPIGEIIHTLIKAIPADGYNETEKILLLNHRFAFWYQTMIELSENFSIQTRFQEKEETYVVKGVNKALFPTLASLESAKVKQLNLDIVDKTAILTIHSFAKSAIKRNGQRFKKFISTTFTTLKKQGIENLVIDLRYNSGGTDGNAALLASYFFDQRFRYWEKIEVTEAVAQEIKGVYRLFFRKPERVDSTYLWKKTWMTSEFDYYQVQKPARHNFKGKTYLLTNGLCMSSCSDFTAILAHNKKAVVIGQESGGGYQGNTSGMMPKTSIPTGLNISVPLQKYTTAVDPKVNFGRGTIPHYILHPSVEDWMNKKDVEMEFVLKLINSQ